MIYPSIPQSFWDGTCFDAYRRMGAHPAAGDKGEADRFFPAIDTRVWQETAREEMTADERHPYNYAFVTYERR